MAPARASSSPFLVYHHYSSHRTRNLSLCVPPRSKPTNEDWKIAILKGTSLYQQLHSGCFPNVKEPVTVAKLVARGWALDGTGGSRWLPVIDYSDGFSQIVIIIKRWTDNSDFYIKGSIHGSNTSYSNSLMFRVRYKCVGAICFLSSLSPNRSFLYYLSQARASIQSKDN